MSLLTCALTLSAALSAHAADPAARAPVGRDVAARHSDALRPVSVEHVRLGKLIGQNVRNAVGENLGEVKDVVVDLQNGRVGYAVVGFGGFLGLGEKLFAFPLQSFQLVDSRDLRAPGARVMDNDGVRGDRGPIGTDRTAAERAGDRAAPAATHPNWRPGDGPTAAGRSPDLFDRVQLVLNVDQARLKEAPGFDRNHWPDWNDPQVRAGIDRYHGSERAADARGVAPRMYRASKVLDADIKDRDGRDIGDVEDLVINLRTGQIEYAVVEFDRKWAQTDKLIVVPLNAFRRGQERDEFVLTADRERLRDAPAFDKRAWPELDRGPFRADVDRYVGSWRGAPIVDRSAPARATDRVAAPRAAGGSATVADLPTDQRR
ncbi:MAG TPA: PRC-barrel domain-containing protein [Burkholderiaceae bacterium]|nr:PRC-barrel domain-containing protein [Burkholderiaceae bacterium]